MTTQNLAQSEASLASMISASVLGGRVELPAMPEVALKARELLAAEHLNLRELDELLTADPAIAAALLRLANSAHFGGMGRVKTINMAVQRIGMQEVGAIVTGLALKGQFDHPDPLKKQLLEVLWDHSITTAFAARKIAKEVGIDPEQAFLGGLLHDCGKVIVLSAIDGLEGGALEVAPTRDVVVELMSQLHLNFGHHLLSTWNIESELAEIARNHEVRQTEATDLLLSVQAANLVTKKLGFHLEPDPDLILTEHMIIEDLGLADITLAELMIDMEDHLAEMKGLF